MSDVGSCGSVGGVGMQVSLAMLDKSMEMQAAMAAAMMQQMSNLDSASISPEAMAMLAAQLGQTTSG